MALHGMTWRRIARIVLYCVLHLLILFLHFLAALCPTGWFPGFHGSCFKIFHKSMGWNAAKSFCVALGANLAILNSQAKVAAVSSKIKYWSWIALHRDPTDGSKWLWIDGSLTNYTNWDSNQPNNWRGIQDCVATKFGKWHDIRCNLTFLPICEKSRK